VGATASAKSDQAYAAAAAVVGEPSAFAANFGGAFAGSAALTGSTPTLIKPKERTTPLVSAAIARRGRLPDASLLAGLVLAIMSFSFSE
jgi:hypothetical protein